MKPQIINPNKLEYICMCLYFPLDIDRLTLKVINEMAQLFDKIYSNNFGDPLYFSSKAITGSRITLCTYFGL